MSKILIFLIFFSTLCLINAEISQTNVTKTAIKRKSLIPLLYDSTLNNINVTKVANCEWLRGYKHQRQQCLVRKGLEKVLIATRKLIISICQQSFKYDTWNCTYSKNQFKKINRETAFLQSLSAAGLMFTVTEACLNKKLQRCKCDESKEYFIKVPDYKNFSGCQDNTKTGKVLTKNFLMAQYSGKKATTANLNVKFGIKVVMESVKIHCRCSTSVFSCKNICEKRLQPFSNIMEKLKLAYHNAIKLKTKHLTSGSKYKLPKDRLLYLSDSSNFCNSTAGRRCLDAENCATLCCGRGFNSRTITVRKKCKYRLGECCYKITHEICTQQEFIYECK
nr:protein Wnt-9a-like [Onthophagus taurus]